MPPTPSTPSHRAVVGAVASYYGLDHSELTRKCRSPHLVRARRVAMVLLQRRGLSQPEIAAALGFRDHSNVCSGLALAKANPDIMDHASAVAAGLRFVWGLA